MLFMAPVFFFVRSSNLVNPKTNKIPQRTTTTLTMQQWLPTAALRALTILLKQCFHSMKVRQFGDIPS